jgi:hypothetical protein
MAGVSKFVVRGNNVAVGYCRLLFVKTVTVHTYTIFIKVRNSYRVLVMLVSFVVTPFVNVTTKLLLRRQADKVTRSVVLATITPSDG